MDSGDIEQIALTTGIDDYSAILRGENVHSARSHLFQKRGSDRVAFHLGNRDKEAKAVLPCAFLLCRSTDDTANTPRLVEHLVY